MFSFCVILAAGGWLVAVWQLNNEGVVGKAGNHESRRMSTTGTRSKWTHMLSRLGQ